MQKDQPGGCQGPRVREAARSSQNLFPRQLLAELIFKRIQCATRAALNAANTLAQLSHAPVSRPPALVSDLEAAMLNSLLTPSSAASELDPKSAPKVTVVPVPLRGLSPGIATSAPKPHCTAGQRSGVGVEKVPLKRWRRPGRRARAGGDVTSGAEEA